MAKRKIKRKYTKKNTSYWQSFTPSGYKRYSGIKMPKILVNKYLAGKLSADSLIKNIIKNNPGIHADKNSTVETLLGTILKRKDRTVAENWKDLENQSRRFSFWEGSEEEKDMKTYTSSLNEAFEKSSAEDRKVLRKYMRDVDFASDQWEYRNGKMITTVYDANGQPILIEVDFNNERAEHDYAISALNIVEKRVAI